MDKMIYENWNMKIYPYLYEHVNYLPDFCNLYERRIITLF